MAVLGEKLLLSANSSKAAGYLRASRWGIAFLAAQSAGAVIVPFDILLPAKTLAYLVRHSGCRFSISSHPFTPLLQKIEQVLPQPLPSLVIGAGASGSDWKQVLEQFFQPVELPLVCRELLESRGSRSQQASSYLWK